MYERGELARWWAKLNWPSPDPALPHVVLKGGAAAADRGRPTRAARIIGRRSMDIPWGRRFRGDGAVYQTGGPRSMIARMDLEVGKSIARYRIAERLGTGGMGVVYRARDERLNRDVALKLLSGAALADDTGAQRFIREAQLAATLNHPNIVTIYEVEEADGYHFIAMEFVEGETLRARLKRGPLELDEVIRIGGDVADALDAAHALGLIHRDIKPANILLAKTGRAKVADFGLAKRVEGGSADQAGLLANAATVSDLSQPGAVVGTVSYMSPEQTRGDALDARSDLF